MSEEIIAVIIGALSAGLFTAIGWIVNHRLTLKKEHESERRKASLEYLKKQIDEFYGPIVGLKRNETYIFEVSTKLLPMKDSLSYDFDKFTEKDYETYIFFSEKYFIPINQKIADLLNTKLTLQKTIDLPVSYEKYLKHQIQYESIHRLMHEKRQEKYHGEDGATLFAIEDYGI